MKILILGASGMLGHKLVQSWKDRFEVWAAIRGKFAGYEKYGIFDKGRTIENIDARDFSTIEAAVKTVRPDVVVNAIGIIKQLPNAKNTILTLTVNSILPHKLAELAVTENFRLVAISTDCVFNGEKGNYIEEDISDAEDLYGKSKYLGEVAGKNCLTLRTSIIGRELETAHSLVEWFLSNRGAKIKGFAEAVYSGFPTIVLADILAGVIENERELEGVYQVSSEPINKFELTKLFDKYYQAGIEIEPDRDFKIDRSLNSDKFRALTGFNPDSWESMVKKMAADPTPYDEWRKS
jgi:dTDP-4-dehydrorhamnose reductase